MELKNGVIIFLYFRYYFWKKKVSKTWSAIVGSMPFKLSPMCILQDFLIQHDGVEQGNDDPTSFT